MAVGRAGTGGGEREAAGEAEVEAGPGGGDMAGRKEEEAGGGDRAGCSAAETRVRGGGPLLSDVEEDATALATVAAACVLAGSGTGRIGRIVALDGLPL